MTVNVSAIVYTILVGLSDDLKCCFYVMQFGFWKVLTGRCFYYPVFLRNIYVVSFSVDSSI